MVNIDRLLRIGNQNILKSRIAGWKRGTDEEHNYCMHILLDTGATVKAVVVRWNYNQQFEIATDAEIEYTAIEKMLNGEFDIGSGNDEY